jgi:multidrug efflux system membrane fusion protein
LSVRTNGLVVPASVIQRGPEGAYAFFVKEDMTAGMTAVKVAQIDQGQALIESGLTNGQLVVVDGQSKVQPGSKVKSAQASEEGGAKTGPKKGGDASSAKGKKAGRTNEPAK